MIPEVGRPTLLDDELLVKIRKCALDGMNLREMATTLELDENTVYGWHSRNYDGFKDKWLSYNHERLIRKAEIRLETSLDSEKEDIVLKAATFTLENLANAHYNKKQQTDLTTKGKEIPAIIGMRILQDDGTTIQN